MEDDAVETLREDLLQDPAWETSKENVRPLVRGRDPEQLEKALQIHPLKKVNLPALPEMDGSEDPLKLCYEYVLQAEQMNPEGTQELIPILETVTKRFVGCEQYKNDEKYLRLWLTYADLLRDPIVVYEFMKSNSIGMELPLFYEAWTLVMEERGNIQESNELYNLGCARFNDCARLVNQRMGFDRRLAESMMQSSQNGLLAPSQGRQPPLNTLRGERRTHAQLTVSQAGNNTPAFQVFADESSTASVPIDERGHVFSQLASHEASVKENNPRRERWNERPLPSRVGAGARSSTSARSGSHGTISIFSDDGEAVVVGSRRLGASDRGSARQQRQLREVKRSTRFLR